jgi:hypothetical protein
MAASAVQDIRRTFLIIAASSSYTTPREPGFRENRRSGRSPFGLASKRDTGLYTARRALVSTKPNPQRFPARSGRRAGSRGDT